MITLYIKPSDTAQYVPPRPKPAKDFARFCDFVLYVRWRMLKHLLQSGVSFDELAQRLGYSRSLVDKIVLSADVDIPLRSVAEWFYCIDGSKPNIGFKLT